MNRMTCTIYYEQDDMYYILKNGDKKKSKLNNDPMKNERTEWHVPPPGKCRHQTSASVSLANNVCVFGYIYFIGYKCFCLSRKCVCFQIYLFHRLWMCLRNVYTLGWISCCTIHHIERSTWTAWPSATTPSKCSSVTASTYIDYGCV
jgi:hypothetical protein